MLYTPRALPSSSIAIFIVFNVVCIAELSSYEFCSMIPRPPSCDCSNTPDGYELRCLMFTVHVKPKAVVHIQCDTTVVSNFSVLSGMRVGEVDTLIIRLCPLPSVSLSQLMQNMGVSNVSNVQLTYTGVANSATTVTRELFHNLSIVTSLTLHTNGTTQLSDDVFTDMFNLTFIDLKSNNIVLWKDIFCSVMKLQVLQLDSTNQTYLEPGVFHSLIHLRLLVLRGNIVKLLRSVFFDIYNLQSLEINSTKLTTLPSDLFADLTKLRKINFYANKFISLPQKLFINNQDLETFNLQDNRLTLNTLPPRLLAALTELKVVKIRNCNMSTLPENLLWGSVSIHTISLNKNAFITLPETLFKDCTKLETLDISYNRMTDLPNQLFCSVTNLKSLKINNNQLSVITDELFLSLRNLMVLDLKDNRLTHVETQAFEMLSSLKAVNMSNNMLTFDEASKNGTTGLSPLKSCHMLEDVQLANNSLIKIFSDWQNLKNLKTLNLAYNKISQIPFADLYFAGVKGTFVNVSYNNISEIAIVDVAKGYVELSNLRIITETLKDIHVKLLVDDPVTHIFIDGNLIKCDCKVPSFLHIPNEVTPIVTIIMETNPGNLQCVKRLEYIEKNLFVFFPLKPFTCLFRKEYSLNCPAECSCPLMISDKALLVDCNRWNLTSVSKREDMLHNLSRAIFSEVHNLEVLEIDSIKMPSLPSDLLLDLTKLRYINLYGNDFLSLPQNLFVNNQNLNAVTIEDNRRTLSTLPPRFLGNFTKLLEVTLRSCNMTTLPEDLLWGSRSIRFISLNRNALTALPKLLFKDCRGLQILDLSYNRLTDLPNQLFPTLTKLNILKINNNQLSSIPKNLFLPLRSLMVLELKDNRLRHIDPQAFITLKSLEVVDMSNNMLTFEDTSKTRSMGLSPLNFCDKLKEIQLANNTLTRIFSDWRKLRDLRNMNLAHNKISQIQAEDLDFNVTKNIFVNISYNNIFDIDIFEEECIYKYVSETAVYNVPVRHFFIEGNPINCDCKVYRFLQFDGQGNIAEIKLSIKTNSSKLHCVKPETLNVGQEIQKISIQYFTCLFKMEYKENCPGQCSCLLHTTNKSMVVECHQTNLTLMSAQENVLQNLSRDIFSDVLNLESLAIKSNRMTGCPQDLLLDLIKLRKISLYANNFQNLPQNLFANNRDLEMINIENNRQTLKTLPPRFMAELTKLRNVRLNGCNISTLTEDLLWGSKSITTISLNNNAFTTLPDLLFRDCMELQFLEISFNRIMDLPKQLFSYTLNLKTLKINNNQLTGITNDLFSFLINLEVLDLKYNKLTHIAGEAFVSMYSLKAVDMSNNMLTFEKSWSPLLYCRKLEDIQLTNNSLTKISVDWHDFRYLQILNLSHNKISQLRDFDLYFISTKNTFINLSYNNITEIVIFDTQKYTKYVPAEMKKYNVLLREILIEGNPITCDCKLYSLLQYRRDTITAQVKLSIGTESHNSQCVNQEGYTEKLRDDIPMKYFTCLFKKEYSLNCPEECRCLFRTTDKALKVDCQLRNLTSMPQALPDVVFSNYTELNLSGNRIKSVKFPLGPGYYKVTKYILSDNMINEINLTAFSSNLQVLQLDGNSINQFNRSSIEFLMNSTYLTQLTLDNNAWSCDCTTKDFVTIIQNTYHLRKIKLLDRVTCKNGKEILKMSHTELCPDESKVIVKESYTVAGLALLFGLLIGLLFALYYKFRKGIRIWLYAHRCCLWFVTEDELDKDKSYDAFVSYAYQDEDFVLDQLVPRLENDQYTLCLHQRDWIPGEFIPAQIATSVDKSRRTLIVLSSAFLESMWGRMEFRAAHKQALSEGRVRVILILYGDIGPTDKLDSELRTYLTMNTYVKWGDQWFWEKLRYAMPHPSKLRKGIPLQERASTSTR